MGRKAHGSSAATARKILDFTRTLEGMKLHTRTAWTSTGRRESIADHSFRLAMLALVIGPQLAGIDVQRLVELCLVHDLGEVLEGDVPAPLQTAGPHKPVSSDGPPATKESTERAAVEHLAAVLDEDAGERLLERWEEYGGANTPEARIAKALDKIETIVQHNQGSNPADFDYAFNLEYGSDLPLEHDLLRALRDIVDQDTHGNTARSGDKPER